LFVPFFMFAEYPLRLAPPKSASFEVALDREA